jgi:signal transduction histidine kinase
MSHELRTPLNAVLGYARLLQREPDLGERQADGLATIEQSGEHLLDLINDLLDLAKVEAGRLDLAPLPLKLAAFLPAVVRLMQVKGDEKGLPVIWEASPGLPSTVLADERRLRQILLNLLDNAVKFTDRGEVRLRVQLLAREEDVVRLRFEVIDTGVGVAADELKHIFKRFEQAGELARRASGTGLGLAISQQLVRLMGSEIQVDSTPGAAHLRKRPSAATPGRAARCWSSTMCRPTGRCWRRCCGNWGSRWSRRTMVRRRWNRCGRPRLIWW